MKKLICLIIFASTIFLACRPHLFAKRRHDSHKRQKKTIDQNCVSYEGLNSVYKGLNSLVDEPKSVTEKNFTNYILSNYPNEFPKTLIVLYIVFQPNVKPCCRLTNVADSLVMDTKQVDLLTNLILKYPVFDQIKFNKGETGKYLFIMMGRAKKGKLESGFAPG